MNQESHDTKWIYRDTGLPVDRDTADTIQMMGEPIRSPLDSWRVVRAAIRFYEIGPVTFLSDDTSEAAKVQNELRRAVEALLKS